MRLRVDSDIDVLVEFDGTATFDGYVGLEDRRIASLMSRSVMRAEESE